MEAWKEGRRWKEMEPGEEKAKRMQTHISWKDCTSRQDRCFLAAAGIYFSANYFFLLASGFLSFFGARVRVE